MRTEDGDDAEGRSTAIATGDDGSTTVTRRSFALASGVVIGTSLAGLPAAGASSPALTVEAGASALPIARRAVESFERTEKADVRLEPTDRAPGDSVRDGTADVHVSGTAVASTRSNGLVGTLSVDRVATLVHPDGTWRECLPPSILPGHLEGDVETWCELGDDDLSTLDPPDGDDVRSASSGGRAPSLVLGTRSYQYARGHGGLGYYEVEPDAIDRDGEAFRRRHRNGDRSPGGDAGSGATARVPIARLAAAIATADDAERGTVRAFLHAVRRSSVLDEKVVDRVDEARAAVV